MLFHYFNCICLIIFNSDVNAWGSFFYEPSNDVLRIKATPEKTEFKEWLSIEFDNLTAGSAHLNIVWGEVKVPIKVEFDQHEVTLNHFKNELTNLQGFNHAAWGAAARYCLNNNLLTSSVKVTGIIFS